MEFQKFNVQFFLVKVILVYSYFANGLIFLL